MAINKIWYLFIEGIPVRQGHSLGDAKGFFVDCLVLAESKKKALDLVRQDLMADGLRVVKIEDVGEFEEFSWENKDHWEELKLLSRELKEPGDICYGVFHTWDANNISEGE